MQIYNYITHATQFAGGKRDIYMCITIQRSTRSQRGLASLDHETIIGPRGASSAAAMTFLTGENRVIHEKACLLFHYASCEELAELKESRLSLERVNSLLISYFCRRTGIEKGFAQKLFSEDRAMYAREALDLGIATEIIK